MASCVRACTSRRKASSFSRSACRLLASQSLKFHEVTRQHTHQYNKRQGMGDRIEKSKSFDITSNRNQIEINLIEIDIESKSDRAQRGPGPNGPGPNGPRPNGPGPNGIRPNGPGPKGGSGDVGWANKLKAKSFGRLVWQMKLQHISQPRCQTNQYHQTFENHSQGSATIICK